MAFQILLRHLFEERETTGFTGIHPTAVIHPTATIGEHCSIGPHAVIDKDAIIGAHSKIGPNCFIGYKVKMGEGCVLHSNVTVRENFGFREQSHAPTWSCDRIGWVWIHHG